MGLKSFIVFCTYVESLFFVIVRSMAQFMHRDPSWMHEEIQRLVHRVLELEKENNGLHSRVAALLKENADLRFKLGATRDETETNSAETLALQQQAQVLMNQIQGSRDNQQRSL